MAQVRANGIDVEYEVFGAPDDEPLLLVMGLGAQLVEWPVELCDLLAERGYRVIRFDNRDVGLSTKFADATVDVAATFSAAMNGEPVDAPYLLTDMAYDAFGLLDALELNAAHVVGASMGGMIAQTMAITRPERVRSLTSIMSTTGDPSVGKATSSDALNVLLQPPPTDREGYIEYATKVRQILSGPGFPFDHEDARRRGATSFDRSFYPIGVGRQLVAILASGDRTPALRHVRVPTLVIHGDADPLVGITGGQATASAVPDAELLVIEGMGHTLPAEVLPRVADAIAGLARGAVAG